MGLVLAIYEYEIFYRDTPEKPHFTHSEETIRYRWIVTITTFIVVGLLIIHSVLKFKRDLETETINLDTVYWNSYNFKVLILEIIINGVHCPPYFDLFFE